MREIIKTAAEHGHAADHGRDFEIAQPALVEHAVEFPERDQTERADQAPKRELESGKRNQQRNRPEDDRAGESQNENGARRGRFLFNFLRLSRCGHGTSSSE